MDCAPCSEEVETFVAVSTVYLQPAERNRIGWCNDTVIWDLTGGDDGTEVWRMDNACGGVALAKKSYQDFEFNGSFQRKNNDDDFIGFVFGYEDSGHFYLIIASGDWDTHGE